jgi:hypothetical protein
MSHDSELPKDITYVGVVMDNKDPDKLLRLKVKILGLFDDPGDGTTLPWVSPKTESLKGDSHILPEIGQMVEITFENNDMYRPFYGGKIATPSIWKNTLCNLEGDKYLNNMILFENQFSSLQYDRANSEFVYKNDSGLLVHITGKNNPTTEQTLDSPGGITIAVGVDGKKADYFSFSMNEDDVILSSEDGKNYLMLDEANNTIELHSDSKTEISSGKADMTFNGKIGMVSSSPGIGIPSGGKFGPFISLPLDPMTGMIQAGHQYKATDNSPDYNELDGPNEVVDFEIHKE